MLLYTTQSFCFDHPTERGTTYLLPAGAFISDAPAWIKDTVLWKLATRDLPGKPAKILIVNSSVKRAIELEQGDTTKLQQATGVLKTRNRGGRTGKAPEASEASEAPGVSKTPEADINTGNGVVTVTDTGNVINQ
jgi:hypothetical protein